MHVYEDDSINGLKQLSTIINDCFYKSMLTTYYSSRSDFWIKCANIINLEHKFKYMLAIRPYAITPEYFIMMYRAFNEIQKNRIMFNIVSGDIKDSESCIDNMIINQNQFDTSQKRVQYTYDWLNKVRQILGEKNMPEIVMSGTSEKTLLNASKISDYTLCMLDSFLDNPKKFKVTKRSMVCAAIVIADTNKQAENIVDNIEQKHQKKWTIFGTEEKVINKILELKSFGVTDLLIRRHLNDPNYESVHNLVKKFKGEI